MHNVENLMPLLSICIPTYNRCEFLIEHISDMLKSNNYEFEIVVLDNCSTDGTVERLNTIDDKRLTVYRNSTILKAQDNWIEILKYAKGKYAYHLNDRDYFKIEYINDLLSVVKKQKDCAVGHIYRSANFRYEVYESGFKAKCKMPYGGYHPSGLLFNVNYIKKHLDLCKYQGIFINGVLNPMPHIGLMYDLCNFGSYVEIFSLVREEASAQFVANSKSGVQLSSNTDKKKMWFEPCTIYAIFKNVMYQIHGDPSLTIDEKKQILNEGFSVVLKACTTIYCTHLLSDAHRNHYQLQRYYIRLGMMTELSIEYIRKFKRDIIEIFSSKIMINQAFIFIISKLRIIKFLLIHFSLIMDNNRSYNKGQIGKE